MAYELGEQLDWEFPDWIIYPTGGGTGMVGMWKAFEEMERIGWKTSAARPQDGLGTGRALRADRARVRGGQGAIGAVPERPHRRRRPARAEGHRRLPRAARHPRERRHGPRRDRRGNGCRHARAGRARRHQRGTGRRRRAARRSRSCCATAAWRQRTRSCCSIPAERSSISTCWRAARPDRRARGTPGQRNGSRRRAIWRNVNGDARSVVDGICFHAGDLRRFSGHTERLAAAAHAADVAHQRHLGHRRRRLTHHRR